MNFFASIALCWTVYASPVSVYDGDTFTARIPIWPRIDITEKIRVQGVNTPELTGATKPAGLAAKAYTEDWLKDQVLMLETCGVYSFERLVARVIRSADKRVLADDLIRDGHGVFDDGKRR